MPDVQSILLDAEERMKKAVDSLKREFGTVRTGRASTSLLDNLKVEYYGSSMPINQLANIADDYLLRREGLSAPSPLEKLTVDLASPAARSSATACSGLSCSPTSWPSSCIASTLTSLPLPALAVHCLHQRLSRLRCGLFLSGSGAERHRRFSAYPQPVAFAKSQAGWTDLSSDFYPSLRPMRGTIAKPRS